MSAAEHLQGRLFAPGPKAERDYTPEKWVASPDIVWHSTAEEHPPKPSTNRSMHLGTLHASHDRAIMDSKKQERAQTFPYQMNAQVAINPPGVTVSTSPWASIDPTPQPRYAAFNDWNVMGIPPKAREAQESGMLVPYRNAYEDKESISYSTSTPDSVKTWSEAVLSDPHSPTHLRGVAEQYDLGAMTNLGSKARVDSPSLPGIPSEISIFDREHATESAVKRPGNDIGVANVPERSDPSVRVRPMDAPRGRSRSTILRMLPKADK